MRQVVLDEQEFALEAGKVPLNLARDVQLLVQPQWHRHGEASETGGRVREVGLAVPPGPASRALLVEEHLGLGTGRPGRGDVRVGLQHRVDRGRAAPLRADDEEVPSHASLRRTRSTTW